MIQRCDSLTKDTVNWAWNATLLWTTRSSHPLRVRFTFPDKLNCAFLFYSIIIWPRWMIMNRVSGVLKRLRRRFNDSLVNRASPFSRFSPHEMHPESCPWSASESPTLNTTISTFNRSAPAVSRRVCGAATTSTGSSGHQVCHFVLLLHFAHFVGPRENVIIIGSSFLSCHVVPNTL